MVGAILLFAIVGFTIFTYLLKKVLLKISDSVRDTVRIRHEAAEHILDNGRIPVAWAEETTARRRSLKEAYGGEAAVRDLALKKIGQLIRYFEKAPVFENSATRRMLLDDLAEARNRWEVAEWPEIAPSSPPAEDSTN